MKTQKGMRKKILVAMALAFSVMPMAAVAATPDDISGTQSYQYANSGGTPYSLYDFTGTGSNVLQFGSTSGYGPLTDETIVLPGIETTDTPSVVANGEIEWQAGGQPTNRLAIANINPSTGVIGAPVSGNGTLTVITDPFSGSSPDNYLNLILAGNQSLGASKLVFDGWGRIAFGSKSAGFGDTQSLELLETNSQFSGIFDFYNANVTLGNILMNSNGYLTSKGGNSTVNLNGPGAAGDANISSTGDIDFGGLTPAGSTITFNIGGEGVQAQDIAVGGSAPGTVVFNMPDGSINLGGTGTAVLDASAVNLGEVGVNGNVDLIGGNLTISPSQMGLQTTNYLQSGGDLTLGITPTMAGFIGASNTFQITGGNVIIDGETGTYKNGIKYTLLNGAGTNGGSVYDPANTFYVYNGTQGGNIDGLTPYLTQTQDAAGQQYVNLCLGGDCVATAAPSPTPTPAPAPAKSTPTPAPAPAPAPVVITPVHIVTPVQEAKQTVANSPHLTLQQARDTQSALISTGIVGGGPRGLWFKGLGGAQTVGNEHGANYGLITGYGWSIGPDRRDVAGVAFSAGQSGLGTGSQNFTKASDYGLWAYGTYYPNATRNWKFSVTIGGGLSTNTLNSTALGLPQMATFGGSFFGAEVRASYWSTLDALDGLVLSPRLSLGYDQSWTSGFQTHGGSFLDVHVDGQSSGQLYAEPAVLIGKKFNYRTTSGNHTLFPQIRLGLIQNIGPNPSATVSSGQVAAQVAGLAYPHTQGMAELRLDVTSHTRYSKGLSGNISVRQTFGGGASQTEAVAAIKYQW